VPKDASTAHPFMLDRTPFSMSPYGPDEYLTASLQTQAFLKAGYIWVRQDVRGRGLSEGEFTHVTPHRAQKTPTDVDESTDTYDSVEWLLRNVANHNGRVGIWGISYDGFFAIAGIIDTHPAIKAASPQAPVADLFLDDDWYHNGAFQLAKNFEGGTGFKAEAGAPPRVTVPFDYGTSDGYEFFLELGTLANVTARLPAPNPMWDETVAHPFYDEYWQSRAIWRHLKHIRCAVLTVGGWFDAEDLMGPLRVYRAIGANNPGISNGLVMGPWVHGGWARHDGRRLGSVDFAADTARYCRENVVLPFFEFHLKDTGAAMPADRARVRDRHQRLAPVPRVAPVGGDAAGSPLPRGRRPRLRATHGAGRERFLGKRSRETRACGGLYGADYPRTNTWCRTNASRRRDPTSSST